MLTYNINIKFYIYILTPNIGRTKKNVFFFTFVNHNIMIDIV